LFNSNLPPMYYLQQLKWNVHVTWSSLSLYI